MHQPQFYQHPGKLGPASRGVSERRHYGILHPVLHYRGQQGVQTHRRNPSGKLSVSAGRPWQMDWVRPDSAGADGSRGRTGKFTAANPHRGGRYVPQKQTSPSPTCRQCLGGSASTNSSNLTNVALMSSNTPELTPFSQRLLSLTSMWKGMMHLGTTLSQTFSCLSSNCRWKRPTLWPPPLPRTAPSSLFPAKKPFYPFFHTASFFAPSSPPSNSLFPRWVKGSCCFPAWTYRNKLFNPTKSFFQTFSLRPSALPAFLNNHCITLIEPVYSTVPWLICNVLLKMSLFRPYHSFYKDFLQN